MRSSDALRCTAGFVDVTGGKTMDLSKLPKMSHTEKTTPPPGQPHEQDPVLPVPDYASARGTLAGAGTGGEVWVSAIISIIFLFLGRNFASYLFAKLTGRPYSTGVIWSTGELSGQPVAYADLMG